MVSLALSELPSGTLHTPAFDRLTFNLNRADVDNTFVLTITRRCDGHVATDKLHLVKLRHESSYYLVSSCEAVQCCPNAPQEDLRYTLFNNGSWVANGSRHLVSGDLHCTRTSPDMQLPLDSRPAPESKEVTLILDKFFSGFAALLNKTDSSSAIQLAWKGDAERASLLSVWENSARRGEDAFSILARTTKTTKKEQAKANYLHWLSRVMLACLVYVQTGGKIKHGEPKKSIRNSFITWSRRIPKILQLLSVAGTAALLILTALGNSFFFFADLVRKSQEHMENFTNTLWEILRPRLSAIDRLLQGTIAYDQRVLTFNPTAFTHWYLTLQLQTPVTNEDVCKQLGVEDWVKIGSEVFEERTIGEVFSSLQNFQSTNKEERRARQNNEEPAHRWAAAWLQSNHIDLTPAHNQDQTLDIANENTPYPAGPSQGISMPNGWPTEQPLPPQVTPVQDTLANAASQVCSPHHDRDSGYGGSAVSSQFSVATSAMPALFRGSETTNPCSQSVSLWGPERPNNVPTRPIGEHRTVLPDEAPPPAALPTGSYSHLTVGEAPVPDDRTAQNPAYDAVVLNEDSLFLPSQPSIGSGCASNTRSQQVRGTTTSPASSSGPFLLETEGRAEWDRAAAGQKRAQVGDNAASKRHRPSAEETTENSDASQALNADPAVRSLCNTDGAVIAFQSNGAAPTTNVFTGTSGQDSFFESLDMDDVPNWTLMATDTLAGIDMDRFEGWNPLYWNMD